MEAGAYNFFSLVKVGYFRLKKYKVLLTVTQVAGPSYRVKGLGITHNFP